VRHLIDPSKLVASATHVYGEARFRELYGEVEPVPAERVRAVEDGETVPLGDATLRFLHVRGHANHHMIVHDPARDAVFTGDAFGLVYPALQRPGPFAFPSTSPTDFDPGEARAAVRRILELRARSAYLTHFGEVTAIDAVAAQLVAWLDVSEVLLDEAVSGDRRGEALVRAVEAELRDRFEGFARDAGFTPTAQDFALVGLDLELNAQGIAWTAARRRDATRPSVV
jgi:glyoxylase-like metal-dependent hydrolase (beta-lactamase superfamily II)